MPTGGGSRREEDSVVGLHKAAQEVCKDRSVQLVMVGCLRDCGGGGSREKGVSAVTTSADASTHGAIECSCPHL